MKKYIFASIFCVVFLLLFASLIKAQTQELTYENEAMGVTITGPGGWYMYTEENSGNYVEKPESFKENIVKEGILIIFSNDPIFYETAGGINTFLSLESKKFTSNDPEDERTPIKVAKKYISPGDEEPKPVTLSGKEGVVFTYTTPPSGPVHSIKGATYVFVKDDTVYTISFFCDAAVYDNFIKDIDSSVDSFILK